MAGLILCGAHPRAAGETFLLAGPRWTTFNELVARAAAACEAVCRPLGIEPPLHRRRCDFFTKDRGFSSAKAERLLGYAPEADLDEALARTAAWSFAEGYLRKRATDTLIGPPPLRRRGGAAARARP